MRNENRAYKPNCLYKYLIIWLLFDFAYIYYIPKSGEGFGDEAIWRFGAKDNFYSFKE